MVAVAPRGRVVQQTFPPRLARGAVALALLLAVGGGLWWEASARDATAVRLIRARVGYALDLALHAYADRGPRSLVNGRYYFPDIVTDSVEVGGRSIAAETIYKDALAEINQDTSVPLLRLSPVWVSSDDDHELDASTSVTFQEFGVVTKRLDVSAAITVPHYGRRVAQP